jgi:3-methyladenine DNA glycosylase AlkD
MKEKMHFSEVFPAGAKTVPELRMAARIWCKHNKNIPIAEFEGLVTECIRNSAALMKCMGGILLDYMPKQRAMINPVIFENWLEYTIGWGEVDAVCYGHFTADEILDDFKNWKLLIEKLSQSNNINKRRGAIVLLTKPLKQSGDKRLSHLGFWITDTLKHEKSILITKAISWLLRNLIKFHRKEVESFLKANKGLLPKIAVRETMNKLETGRKDGV